MKNILITGGAGYIGTHINFKLSKLGYNVIIYDNLSTVSDILFKSNIFIKGDINDTKSLENIFKKYDPFIVIHLASLSNVGESLSNTNEYYTVNVNGTINLLNVMIKYNTKYLIFSSSCSIYGHSNIPITEKSLINPISPYGKTKYICEEVIKDYSKRYKFNYFILRYFNVAGADLINNLGENHICETRIIPVIINNTLNNKTVYINGNNFITKDGTVIRDFIHIDDISEAHIHVINYLINNNLSNTCNLGSNSQVSILDIIKIFEEISNLKVNFSFNPKIKEDPDIAFCNYTYAKQLLNWEPKKNIYKIIESSYLWIINKNKII